MSATGLVREFGILHRTFFNFVIGEVEGITRDGLPNFIAVDKAAAARPVKRMEAAGYLRIARPITDKRTKKLHLTEKGRLVAELLKHRNEIWVDPVMEEIEPHVKAIVVRSIRRMSGRAMTLT